jgi:hypothetical protein
MWGQKASAAKGFYKGHRDIAEKALHHFIKAYSTKNEFKKPRNPCKSLNFSTKSSKTSAHF